jgi:carboxyl-terminal processing protease
VRFLTDPLTYSASEDALLGLQGLPHVRVVGEASGGGSGRMRVLRFLPGWNVTSTTCHTSTVAGHVVEGHGIPVDHPVRAQPRAREDDALAAADR